MLFIYFFPAQPSVHRRTSHRVGMHKAAETQIDLYLLSAKLQCKNLFARSIAACNQIMLCEMVSSISDFDNAGG